MYIYLQDNDISIYKQYLSRGQPILSLFFITYIILKSYIKYILVGYSCIITVFIFIQAPLLVLESLYYDSLPTGTMKHFTMHHYSVHKSPYCDLYLLVLRNTLLCTTTQCRSHFTVTLYFYQYLLTFTNALLLSAIVTLL